ncbi:helix-turn-helix transcriptional regulator [Altererythrobacter salegens]|uniref:Helix-turn-helix transcriptional regulator n=1 Tax=Croceibacterium salegens TaxID=1737568 RepID=A0A6I4SU63_9SPHN|nr:LuxR C-terminal-related transcriptional regulator [Croceibacterium salegens]MXO59413.1 helix-turn-helix transcriptional regulator [Croceibacterium salegens]
MEKRITLHIVDGNMRSRAEQARTAFALGHHAEVYDDLDELLAHPPKSGVLVVRQRTLDQSLSDLLDRLGEYGIWLPVIVCAPEPLLERVVQAIKQGALDYLQLPLEANQLSRSLSTVMREARSHSAARRRLIHARGKVASLSRREREVLEWLSEGSSNKLIARELAISPRTVEIHRANMMTKLGAGHAAEAVRMWIEARLEHSITLPDLTIEEARRDFAGERDRHERMAALRRLAKQA